MAGRIVFIAWRDLANENAGGSEILVDRLAQGLQARGDQVTLLCGGRVGEREYAVRRSGGTYSQFVRAPVAFQRHLRDCDLVVEVCNGMPYLAPLWTQLPVICLVNHVHADLWALRFPPPVSVAGRFDGVEGDAVGAPQEPLRDGVGVHVGGADPARRRRRPAAR